MAPGYADIHVKWQDKALWGFHAGEWFSLNHYHYDVFELDMLEAYGANKKLSFTLNNDGAISTLLFSIEPEVGDTQYRRADS